MTRSGLVGLTAFLAGLGGAPVRAAPPAGGAAAPAPAQATAVTVCRQGATSRVEIPLSRATTAKLFPLAADAPSGAVARLVVDVQDARAARALPRQRALRDPLIAGWRLSPRPRGHLRFVLDLAAPAEGTLAVESRPSRLVVVVAPAPPAGGAALAQAGPAALGQPQPPAPPRRPLVVVDPGHGGQDGGAIGVGGVLEKDVTLAVARELRALLEAGGVAVALTRNADITVGLDERTRLANRLGADVFVSIHANASARGDAQGIETYTLDVTHNRYSIRLAARENRTSVAQADDLQMILADLSTKFSSHTSRQLARRVQDALVHQASQHHPQVRDLGVKEAMFYVLMGARMPSILTELSFLTHPVEARLLVDPIYQRLLARGLGLAITNHLSEAPSEARL